MVGIPRANYTLKIPPPAVKSGLLTVNSMAIITCWCTCHVQYIFVSAPVVYGLSCTSPVVYGRQYTCQWGCVYSRKCAVYTLCMNKGEGMVIVHVQEVVV